MDKTGFVFQEWNTSMTNFISFRKMPANNCWPGYSGYHKTLSNTDAAGGLNGRPSPHTKEKLYAVSEHIVCIYEIDTASGDVKNFHFYNYHEIKSGDGMERHAVMKPITKFYILQGLWEHDLHGIFQPTGQR